jgi:murein L,D-transpeptidase YafK
MRNIALVLLFTSCWASAEIDLVKVDKSENKLYLIENNQVIKEYRAAFGANPKGHKEQQGDGKTPEGVYFLDYKKEDSAFYRAMHISYPNKTDIAKAKRKAVSPGGSIMVHGQRNKRGWRARVAQRFNWTNGCIALTNDEMDEFMSLVKVGTKIIIEW